MKQESVNITEFTQGKKDDENRIVKDCLDDLLMEISNQFEENIIKNDCINLKEKANHYNSLSNSVEDDSFNQSVKRNNTE